MATPRHERAAVLCIVDEHPQPATCLRSCDGYIGALLGSHKPAKERQCTTTNVRRLRGSAATLLGSFWTPAGARVSLLPRQQPAHNSPAFRGPRSRQAAQPRGACRAGFATCGLAQLREELDYKAEQPWCVACLCCAHAARALPHDRRGRRAQKSTAKRGAQAAGRLLASVAASAR